MSVHYKFKSALEYDTVTFDGLHISVRDLKNAIMQQKRIGKGTDFDLQVTNAQTKEVYEDNDALIPKNTSLLIARIPSSQVKVKTWEGYGGNASPDTKVDDIGPIGKTADLSKLDASEEDKIRAMMSQSTQDYDPSNYLKIRGSNQVGAVPPNYRCFKCHQGGHWIKDCPLSQGAEPMEIKKSTGIPRSFMVPVEGPQVPGAMMTPNGSFAVPVLDHQAYNEKPQPPAPPEEKQPEIPEDLVCSICSDLLTDAVMIPCCGNSFCDECIRSILLESEDHECPDCHDRDISPTTLIPNRFLRNAVANFKNTTGYVKRHVYKPAPTIVEPPEAKKDEEPEKVPTSTTPTPVKEKTPPPATPQPETEKLVISEADSTETPRAVVKDATPEDKVSSQQIDIPEGPPGVSPKKDESPRAQPITTMATVPRSHGFPRHKTTHDRSPRRHHPHQKSPSYKESISHIEDRPGTPTVDEPGGMENIAPSTNDKSVYQAGMQAYGNPLPGVMPPVGVHPPVVGPHTYRPTHPPIASYQGPPPNFRMPPPMSNPPPYLPNPYTVPPRPIYDGDRTAPYSNFSSNYRPPRGREFPPRDTLRRGRTPPGIIDDPLAAFERMLKEKDERERRAKQRKTRSYSRSSSRSYSRSPVPRRGRSRSPRRRISRSRSRSFSISRSRSRSFSPSPRGSPPRDYSPRGSPRHKGPPRYRSPIKSPPRGPLPPEPYRGAFKRGDRDRDFDRDRDYHHPPPHHHRDRRGYSKDRDKDYGTGGRDMRGRGPPPLSSGGDYGHAPYYDSYDRGGSGGRKQNQGPPPVSTAPSSAQWNQPPSMVGLGPPRKEYQSSNHPYYGTDIGSMHRYHARDENPTHHLPPLMQPPPTQQPPSSHLPHIRQYDDIAPPGVEQPPIPGLESTPKYEERYTSYETDLPSEKFDNYDRIREERLRDERKRDDRGNYRDDRIKDRDERVKERDERSKEEKPKDEKARDERDEKGRGRDEDNSEGRGVRRSRHSRSPEKSHESSSKPSKARSPEKYKRRKWDESSESREKRSTHEKDKSRRRDTSDDNKKSRDKKKRKEKKESEKKKRKDKKEKRDHDKDKTRKTDGHDSEQEKILIQNSLEPKDKEPQRSKETDEKVLPETEPVGKREESPEAVVESTKETAEAKDEKIKNDLYGDLLNEDVDSTVIQTYGKLTKNDDNNEDEQSSKVTPPEKEEETIIPPAEQKEIFVEEPKDFDDSERDILEIHTNESDLKPDLELKNEVLAPMPEKSKWEVEEDSAAVLNDSSKLDSKSDKSDKSAKVTNEVLKRAENAIFAKAINAIRPIEIKKISLDRVKLYSGERDGKERKVEEYKDTDGRNIQVTIPVNYESEIHVPATETKPVIANKPRLSVKERLGVKVDDLDNIIQVERNRSRSLSPFSRRANYADRNLGHGERKVQLDERRRRRESSRDHPRSSRYDRKDPRTRDRNYHRTERSSKRDRDPSRDRNTHVRQDRRKSRTPAKKISHERAKSKHKRDSSSSSCTSDKKATEKKKKDKKREKKRDKSKKHHKEEESKDSVNTSEKVEKKEENKESTKASAERRKSMIDEAHFEPDYDLETESEKEDKPKEEAKKRSKTPDSLASKKRKLDKRRDSSSESSSSSTSEEEKKKKKHRKRKKKKAKKESSSSSSSESESESSVDEKDRKKKKHKKKQKKRKKSKK